MYKIKNILAREVLDSRGNPTIEVDVFLLNPNNLVFKGTAIVPSGASTGIHEALELRDGDKKRYMGKGVLKAVSNVNSIIKDEIIGKTFDSYNQLDLFLIKLDGTKNKSKLGANAILGVSMAFVVACANMDGKFVFEYLSNSSGNVLPIPMMNIINGGSHADNSVDIQEFMIVPVGAKNIKEAIRIGSEIFHTLKKILKDKGYVTSVGDEGGYAPDLSSNEEAFMLIVEAINKAGYNTDIVKLAIDSAASEFFKNGKYVMEGEGKILNSKELVNFYKDMVKKYPIISIEDGFAEDDFDGWNLIQNELGSVIKNVGDDLLVTNIERLSMAIDKNLCNSILIKLNQIGTVSETINAINMAHLNNMDCIISHRSGETEDSFIADLSVAMNTGYIKTGSLSRTDRVAKYNQLIRIEEHLGNKAKYGK